jgi:hypothetical protein
MKIIKKLMLKINKFNIENFKRKEIEIQLFNIKLITISDTSKKFITYPEIRIGNNFSKS